MGHEAKKPDISMDSTIETSVANAVFGGGIQRREFMKLIGAGSAAALLPSVFPIEAAKALAQERLGPPEKKDLKVAFIPITCATPILIAGPMGFYRKYGLNVELVKATGWGMIRDLSINKETDATHMLSPMPLAYTLGVGARMVPYVMPIVSNINGQAVTLATKHKGIRSVADMKGFKMAVPFNYSMHNMLLRYLVAEAGLDPDRDIEIRAIPPAEMVGNLQSGTLDGYLAPEPFNQQAVNQGVGFILMLSKEIWPGHPCCAFAATREFAEKSPNTFQAFFRAVVDASHYANSPANRREIARVLSAKEFLNQSVEVVEQVLTGTFPDGLGKTRTVPDRIGFDPFPYHSMAIWILTQMKRWGYVKGEVDYRKVAEQVFLASACRDVMKALGYNAPAQNITKHTFAVGKTKVFDPDKPEEYLRSFTIRKA